MSAVVPGKRSSVIKKTKERAYSSPCVLFKFSFSVCITDLNVSLVFGGLALRDSRIGLMGLWLEFDASVAILCGTIGLRSCHFGLKPGFCQRWKMAYSFFLSKN